ncbi:MAG TPA: TonB-dependent receptor [Chitinophagaceae bacterium]|nr:TonB-dependent receptor [Chitinophagaceae bacterium]
MFIRLYGTITDSLTGQPLAGTSITVAEARIGAIADARGQYQLQNMPSGHHLVEISHTGYATLVSHLDITGDEQLNFALVPSITENQGVTVTGVTNATSIRHIPIPVTLIRRAELLQTPSTNLIDAISHQPGIAQVSTGPAISKPVIRGLGYNRVVVVNDGVRQEGQQWGDEHGIEIDEASVMRAEILKGPAALTYGSDALAGVINFITNTPVAEGTVKGNIYTGYQTANGQMGLNGSIAGNKRGFNWNAYGSLKSTGDYRNNRDGLVLNSRFNEHNFGGYVGFNKSWGFSHLIVSSFNQNIGLIEGDRDSATGRFLLYSGTGLERIATSKDLESRSLFVPRQNVQHYKLILDNSFKAGAGRVKLNVGYQDNIRKEFGNPDAPDEKGLHFDLKTTTYNLQWVLPEQADWQTTIGVSSMTQSNQNKGLDVLIPEYKLFDLGGFVFTQKTIAKATFSGGLRFDNRAINAEGLMKDGLWKFAPFKKTFATVSGSAGVSYTPVNHVTIKLNAARGFRAPTLSELASNGAHEGTNRYEYGAQDLTSEKSWQGDAGALFDYPHITVSVNGFYNRLNHFIFYRRLQNNAGTDSLLTDAGQVFEAFQYSQLNASLRGFEASIDLHPHPLDWLHFENTISLVRGTFETTLDGSNNLPLIPAPRWISEVRVTLAKQSQLFKGLYLHAEADNTFKQNHPFTGYNTETATPGYTLFNIGSGAEILRKGNPLFSLNLAVNNLADKAYQNHLSRLKYTDVNNATGRRGVYNTGRNFSMRLTVPLNISAKK